MSDDLLKERIEELELELKTTKVNKKTEMAVGQLKSKIAKLKEELEAKQSKGKKGAGYAVKKEGDATIGLLGKPSVGKSTLLSKITNKESKIGAYEFTTLEVVPGLLNYKFVNFQVLDLPGIIDRASDNRGFGKKVLSVVRACDLVLLVVDITTAIKDLKMLLIETSNSGIRINKTRPNINIINTSTGGVRILTNFSEDKLPEELVKSIFRENKILNVDILINEKNLGVDELIDAIYENMVYTRGAIILNKSDKINDDEAKKQIKIVKKNYPGYNIVAVSATMDTNLIVLKDFLFINMDFISVYLKEPRKEPDLTRPLIVKRNDNIEQVCAKIHKDFLTKFRYAKIKGSSVKFKWQRVGFEHIVKDNDIIEITLK